MTRVINFGFQATHSVPTYVWQTMRKLTYTNPCETTTFFNALAPNPILSLSHILGIFPVKESNIGLLTPDSKSNSLGSTDNYTYCNQARVYSVNGMDLAVIFDTFKFDTVNTFNFKTGVAYAQQTEFAFTFNVVV